MLNSFMSLTTELGPARNSSHHRMFSSRLPTGIGDSPVRSSTAGLPVKRWKRSTITSQYGGSSSIRNALRPVCSAPISVEPLPPNRSSTFSPVRRVLHRPDGELGRLSRQMLQLLRRNLLDVPQVGGVVRAKELVSRPLLSNHRTPIRAPMKSLRVSTGCCLSHTIACAEVRARWLQGRADSFPVGVAAPDVEARDPVPTRGRCCRTTQPAARSNASSDTKSFSSGRSLGRSFFCVGLRLLRMSFDIELLVMLVPWNELIAGRDRVVATRFHLHVVRRVRVHQVDRDSPSSSRSTCFGIRCCRHRATDGRQGSTGRLAA